MLSTYNIIGLCIFILLVAISIVGYIMCRYDDDMESLIKEILSSFETILAIIYMFVGGFIISLYAWPIELILLIIMFIYDEKRSN